jgi:hypothetical protein
LIPSASAAKSKTVSKPASSMPDTPSKKKKAKQFRFAEVANQSVRTVVYCYSYGCSSDGNDFVDDESVSSTPTAPPSPATTSPTSVTSRTTAIKPTDEEKELMWWSVDDLRHFRVEAIETVQYFKRYRADYMQLVETVAACSSASSAKLLPETAASVKVKDNSASIPSPKHTSQQTSRLSALEALQEQLLQNAMKQLVQDSYARGLEIHICSQLGRRRKETVQAVLEEQQDCWASSDSYETTSHCLREQSLAYSQWSSRFALKMAECDTIDALQASLSRWSVEPDKRMEV